MSTMNLHQNVYIKQALIDSISGDAEQFLQHWAAMNLERPNDYPEDLTQDQWVERFWAWMEGE